jgi:hypothetical protein
MRMLGRRKTPEPICIQAWSLTEGDIFPGGESVVLIERQPTQDRMIVLCTDGHRRAFTRTHRVVLRARPTLRIPRFIAGTPPELLAAVLRPVI